MLQGKELERIFKEEGVIDGDESDQENKEAVIEKLPKIPVSKEPEVIGHMETSGELVVMIKGKGRGRPKGKLKLYNIIFFFHLLDEVPLIKFG